MTTFSQRATALALIAALFLGPACGKSPTGPTDGGVDRVTATIDGQPFSASVMAASTLNVSGGPVLSIVAFNGCQGDTSLNLTVRGASATGTYTTGIDGTINRMAAGQSTGVWSASTGSVTISSLSQTRVTGTFTFPELRPSGTTGTRSITNGAFDIQLQDRKLC